MIFLPDQFVHDTSTAKYANVQNTSKRHYIFKYSNDYVHDTTVFMFLNFLTSLTQTSQLNQLTQENVLGRNKDIKKKKKMILIYQNIMLIIVVVHVLYQGLVCNIK